MSLDLDKKTVTSDDGAFQIPGLMLPENAGVTLHVTHSEYGSDDFRRTFEQTKRFLELNLSVPRDIEGWVVDTDGDSVAGARVVLEAAVPDLKDSVGDEFSYSGKDGSFRLKRPKVLPYWGIELVATQGELVGRSDRYRKNTPSEIEIVVKPAFALTGRVVNASGDSIANAAVHARRLTRRNERTSLFNRHD